MNIKTISTSVIAAIIVVVIAFIGFAPKSTNTTTTVVKGTDIGNSPALTVNGVTRYFVNMPMKTGTTTVCSFPNPNVTYGGASSTMYTASTTLEYFAMHFNTATTAAMKYDMGTSSAPQGTSSALISAFSVGANATSSATGWIPTTWLTGLVSSADYLNVVSSAPDNSSHGYCEAIFINF